MQMNSAPSPSTNTPYGNPQPSWSQRWDQFWFTPTAPIGLHVVRILTGLTVLGWLVPLTGHHHAFFSLNGWFGTLEYQQAQQLPNGMPFPLGWSLLYVVGDNPTLFEGFWWGSLALIALFTLGIAPRITGVLTWVVTTSMLANPSLHFDGDFIVVIATFYMMLAYLLLGQWSQNLTPLERVLGPSSTWIGRRWTSKNATVDTPSYAANFVLRMMQIHFAFIIVTSALHKLQFGDWWAGVAYWYPLVNPFTNTRDTIDQMRPNGNTSLFMLTLVQYLVLAWQLAFPAFAFRTGMRWLLIGGAVLGWIGLIFVYGMPAFGPIYLTFCCAFISAEEWRAWFAKVPGMA